MRRQNYQKTTSSLALKIIQGRDSTMLGITPKILQTFLGDTHCQWNPQWDPEIIVSDCKILGIRLK